MIYSRHIFFTFFIALSVSAHSQHQVTDSLKQVLLKKIPDSTRIQILLKLSNLYCESNADTALHYVNGAMRMVDTKGMSEYLPAVLRNKAIILVVMGDYSTATDYLRKALKENTGNTRFSKKERALCYNLLGVIQDYQGNYDSALFYDFKSLEIFKELNDKPGIAVRYSNIGFGYQRIGNFPLALKYFFDSFNLDHGPRTAQNIGITYAKMNERAKAKKYLLMSLKLYHGSNEPENTGVAYVNQELGNFYSAGGESDSAMYYLRNALRINEKARHINGMAQDHYFFGLHYKNSNDWGKALSEANTAIDFHQQGGGKMGIAESVLLKAEALFNLNRTTEALQNCASGLVLSKELKSMQMQKGFLQLLSNIHASQKNFPLAYSYSQQLIAIKDSINNEEKIKQVANMEALYENDKKEKELAVVRAEKLTADAQLSEQQTRSTLLIVGLSFVSLVLATGIFFYIALRKNRKALELKNAELLKLNQTKDRFFAIVGHDLRGPITSFSGINDLLNWYISKNDMEQLKSFGGKITQSVRQLDTLLNNLLNWAMSQTDAVPYKPEPLQLNQLTKECYGYFQHSLEVKQITLTDEASDELFVHADKNALATVLRNLVSNAIKFTPPKGAIKISAKAEGNFVWIEVRDSGVGLSEEKLKTIFTLSDSKSTSGTQGEKGTGLGLVLCADYVALNKGEIKVESKEGEGTVFRFSVPSFQPKELEELKRKLDFV
jgi:two-component system, NtrC family, sensor kinase